MAQYDVVFTRNDHATGLEFTEVVLGKPAGMGYFLTQNPSSGLLGWSKTLESPVINGTVSGSAIVTDLSSAPAAGKLLDALATYNYMGQLIGANDAMVYKGGINCSTNPNYPAGQVGWTWKVTAAGKIGGASGTPVEIGDTIICSEANGGGTEATVGSKFTIIQGNIDGALYDGMFSSNGLLKRTGVKTYAVITDNSSNWNTAYGWGNHASAGYATAANLTAHINDSTKHVPANGATNNKKVLTASGTSGVFTWAFVNWDDIINKPDLAGGSHTHVITDISGLQAALDNKSNVGHGHNVVTTSVDGFMSAADKVKLNGIASGANNYVLPTATSTVLGGVKIGSRISISSGVISADVQSDNNFTTALKNKLDGIEAGANNYVHPTSDGNKHVPATGTTNNTKVLKAGATAGSFSWGYVAWGEIDGAPTSLPPTAHTHTIAQVNSLQAVLDSKPTVVQEPTAHNSSGNLGQIGYDANYLYVCIATNMWRRTPLAKW
ncbi:MAG: head fiber protein [Bacteroidetes bacterium]|jgi:hypothetical protein|nr:head fiber protein [Bacteroidota bacterium]